MEDFAQNFGMDSAAPVSQEGEGHRKLHVARREDKQKGETLKATRKGTVAQYPSPREQRSKHLQPEEEKPQVCPTPCSGPVFLAGEEKQLQRSPPDLPSRST